MPNLTSVGITAGVPTSGTGTVSTIDALLAVVPSALASGGGLKVDGSGTPLVIGGTPFMVPGSPTVSSSPAYTSGDCMGGLITLAAVARISGGGGLLSTIYLNCKSLQTLAIDAIFFNANPSASTFTDNAAVAIAAADFDKIVAVAHITDWTALGTPSFAQATVNKVFKLASGTTAYLALVARGAITLASTSDLTAVAVGEQD